MYQKCDLKFVSYRIFLFFFLIPRMIFKNCDLLHFCFDIYYDVEIWGKNILINSFDVQTPSILFKLSGLRLIMTNNVDDYMVSLCEILNVNYLDIIQLLYFFVVWCPTKCFHWDEVKNHGLTIIFYFLGLYITGYLLDSGNFFSFPQPLPTSCPTPCSCCSPWTPACHHRTCLDWSSYSSCCPSCCSYRSPCCCCSRRCWHWCCCFRWCEIKCPTFVQQPNSGTIESKHFGLNRVLSMTP